MRREPEVPEEKVPVVECLDGPARITSKELAPIHSVKSGILQNACFTRPRAVADLGRSARMHIVRLMNNVVRGPKRMMTKSAVAMLKKYDLHDGTWQPVVNRDKSHDRTGQHVVKRDTCHELKHGPVGRRSSNTRQFDTKILRLDIFAQVNLISVAPTLQFLRIGLRRRQSGKSKVPAKQRGSWPRVC